MKNTQLLALRDLDHQLQVKLSDMTASKDLLWNGM